MIGGVHAAKEITLMHTVRLEYERQLWDPDALNASAHDQPETKLIDYGGIGFLLLDGSAMQASATIAKSAGSRGSISLPSSLGFLGSEVQDLTCDGTGAGTGTVAPSTPL